MRSPRIPGGPPSGWHDHGVRRPLAPGLRLVGLVAAALALLGAAPARLALATVSQDACVGDGACDEGCPDDGESCPPGCDQCPCAAHAVPAVLPSPPPGAGLAPRGQAPALPAHPACDGESPQVFRPPRAGTA
jgi:hypothetical protein